MEGSVRLVARLSRKADEQGEDIVICPWESHNELQEALLERVQHSSMEPSGTMRMSPEDIAWLRERQPGDALDAALDDLAEDPGLIFEYSWEYLDL